MNVRLSATKMGRRTLSFSVINRQTFLHPELEITFPSLCQIRRLRGVTDGGFTDLLEMNFLSNGKRFLPSTL